MVISGMGGIIGPGIAIIRSFLESVMLPLSCHGGDMRLLGGLGGHLGISSESVLGSEVEPSSSLDSVDMCGSIMAEQREDRTRSPNNLNDICRKKRKMKICISVCLSVSGTLQYQVSFLLFHVSYPNEF